MTDYTTRPATLSDCAAIQPILAEGHAVHQEALPHIYRAAFRHTQEAIDWLAPYIEQDDKLLLVAEQQEQIAGVLLASIWEPPDRPHRIPRRFVHVNTLDVTAAHRRRGVGQILMREVERWAREQGLSEIELNVWAFNDKALRLYERLGYQAEYHHLLKQLDPD